MTAPSGASQIKQYPLAHFESTLGLNSELSPFQKCPFRVRFHGDELHLRGLELHKHRRPLLVLRHIWVICFQPIMTLEMDTLEQTRNRQN